MPRAEGRGTGIEYEVFGAGEPLVLLNGVMMSMQSWVLVRRPLAEDFRCVLHDFRGQLLSPAGVIPSAVAGSPSSRDAGDPSTTLGMTHALGMTRGMSEHVDDLAALLDHLGIDRAHVAGTSYGGEVAMMFAAAHPERVRSLTVIASVSHIDAPLRDAVTLWRDVALTAPQTLYDITAPYNFSPAFLTGAFLEAGRARLASYPPEFFRDFAGLCDAFLQLDLTATLGRIRCPALVICGEDDALKPVHYSRAIAAGIPTAELEIVPRGPHAVVIERPEAVTGLMRSFLTRN